MKTVLYTILAASAVVMAVDVGVFHITIDDASGTGDITTNVEVENPSIVITYAGKVRPPCRTILRGTADLVSANLKTLSGITVDSLTGPVLSCNVFCDGDEDTPCGVIPAVIGHFTNLTGFSEIDEFICT